MTAPLRTSWRSKRGRMHLCICVRVSVVCLPVSVPVCICPMMGLWRGLPTSTVVTAGIARSEVAGEEVMEVANDEEDDEGSGTDNGEGALAFP